MQRPARVEHIAGIFIELYCKTGTKTGIIDFHIIGHNHRTWNQLKIHLLNISLIGNTTQTGLLKLDTGNNLSLTLLADSRQLNTLTCKSCIHIQQPALQVVFLPDNWSNTKSICIKSGNIRITPIRENTRSNNHSLAPTA